MSKKALDISEAELDAVRAAVREIISQRLDDGATIVSARGGLVIANERSGTDIQHRIIAHYGGSVALPARAKKKPIRFQVRADALADG